VSKTNALQRTDNFTKRGSCAAGKPNKSYNVPFHVGGLFIILFVSTTACAFPILVIKFPRLRIPISFLFSAKHFGTGVLIATAFVHLLPTAFISLGNPCLSGFWTTDYPAMPGAIALVSIFFVTIVEMIFSPAQHACGGGSEGVNAISRTQHDQGSKTPNGPDMVQSNPPDSSQMRNLGPLQGRKTSISRTLSRMEEGNQKRDELETATQREQDIDVDGRNELAIVDGGLTPDQAQKKAILQCLLLEMGILFHSIFIGMSLSVSVGSEFVILLIAIIFHRK
jgi:zinc transporter 1/2/3